MGLVDVLEEKDIAQLGKVLLTALDRLKEIVTELRDETTIRVTIEFEHMPKP